MTDHGFTFEEFFSLTHFYLFVIKVITFYNSDDLKKRIIGKWDAFFSLSFNYNKKWINKMQQQFNWN